jgi:anti-anti-sigma regulatory factor
MRWRLTKARDVPTVVVADPLVLPITDPVTADTAGELVSRVGRLAANNRVVVDLTAIPAFDTDGAEAIVGLQESLAERVTIVGFRQAAARLTGTEVTPPPAPPAEHEEWVVRRMRAIAVVHPGDSGTATTDHLEPAVAAALDAEVGIVVVDLRDARLTDHGVDTIAFASSTAALRGMELLVVNADEDAAVRLRAAGLSATTYVAPEPLPDT